VAGCWAEGRCGGGGWKCIGRLLGLVMGEGGASLSCVCVCVAMSYIRGYLLSVALA